MAWTWLRACYGFNMRVWVGGVETIYPARFFFCDPDAQWFPSPHGAEASPWLKDHEVNEEWGDDGTLKKLDRGINPGYPGQCFVGDPQWFIDGQLPASVGDWTTPVITPCCGYVPTVIPDHRCPTPPCQPEYFGARTLVYTTLYGSGNWYFDGSGSGETQWGSGNIKGIAGYTQFFFLAYHLDFEPNPCFDSDWTLIPYICDFGITDCFPLTFLSYDRVTQTGVWAFPLFLQPLFGETVTLQWV